MEILGWIAGTLFLALYVALPATVVALFACAIAPWVAARWRSFRRSLEPLSPVTPQGVTTHRVGTASTP